MKKTIAVLGSTGSIGSTLLKLIDKKKFKISFLLANKNYRKILSQAKKFKVKDIIIIDDTSFIKAKKINTNNKLNIHNKNYNFNKLINTKLEYVMSSITGLAGLKPTFEIIKHTKKIAIANKESLICAWPLLKKELEKNKTEFIPVDSEHFSIWSEIKNINPKSIKKIYLTASGGPFLKYNFDKINKVSVHDVLKHPTWQMGKKISVDSATMMNKCFEIIEAKNIFNLDYNQLDILIHQDSYAHSIICYKNGLSKIILHDTTMEIPIFNSIYSNNELYKKSLDLNIYKMNNLKLERIDNKRFPVIKVLNNLPNRYSLFETVIVALNDFLVDSFLQKKIHFTDVSKKFLNMVNSKYYQKFQNICPKNINEIISLNNKITKSLQIKT